MATDRASFGSVLFELPEDSSRTREPSLGWTSRTCSPGGEELLGQQVPQPVGALDGPGPLGPGRGPFDQRRGLGRRGADLQRAELALSRVDHYRGVRSLVRARTRSSQPSSAGTPFPLLTQAQATGAGTSDIS
jgi:hypothetical protein